jgi:predicted Zn-ribbon and HTH transcriptional regulator
MTDSIISNLLNSDEPSIRYKVLVKILGKNPNSKEIEDLQHQIKISRQVMLTVQKKSAIAM